MLGYEVYEGNWIHYASSRVTCMFYHASHYDIVIMLEQASDDFVYESQY
jgi:hypothetical protein